MTDCPARTGGGRSLSTWAYHVRNDELWATMTSQAFGFESYGFGPGEHNHSVASRANGPPPWRRDVDPSPEGTLIPL